MTYDEFLSVVLVKHKAQYKLRLGQVFFNELLKIRPEIAEEIRGSRLDPFYKNEIASDINDFVCRRW